MYLLNIFRASVCLLSSQQALKNMTREESRELTSIRRKFIGLWSTWSSLKEKEMAPNVGASTPVLLRNNKIIYIYNFFFLLFMWWASCEAWTELTHSKKVSSLTFIALFCSNKRGKVILPFNTPKFYFS
jgi:hypothetical protein